MIKSIFTLTAYTAVLSINFISLALADEKKNDIERTFRISQKTDDILAFYCYDCHEDGRQKGDIRLDNLIDLDRPQRLDLLNRMQEQVYFGHMPPKKEDQPSEAERKSLLEFISTELKLYNASTLEGKLQKPEYGNYVDHEKLFSGEYKNTPGFTYDRRWLISEFIFDAKFQRITKNTTSIGSSRNRRKALGGTIIQGLNLANPFLLPNKAGVRYYATEDFTGGHLSSMLTNAQNTAEYITSYLVPRLNGKKAKYLPAIVKIMALDDQHEKTLASRREFLENFIAKYSAEIYGDKHESLLPKFKPVVIKELKKLEKGEEYKKAPTNVSLVMLKKLKGIAIYHFLMDPEHKNKSDAELKEMCERLWFNFGDYERDIQGRMAILREYMPEIRENLVKDKGRKLKPVVYKPLDEAEMLTIKASIMKHRKKGDHFNEVIEKCMAEWETAFKQERIDAGPPSDELLTELIDQLFALILERSPTSSEVDAYLALSKSYVTKLGKLKAVQKLIQTFILSSEFSYRQEFGKGTPDKHDRRMLSPRDASYAISYALSDQSPDEELVKAAQAGKLNTREDYKREVERILKKDDTLYIIDRILGRSHAQNSTNLPIRKLRFFREFFGYQNAFAVFKDEKRFGGDRLEEATARLINEADRLVEYILKNDKNVFEELLGTEKFYVYHDGDNERMKAASDNIKRIYAYFKDKDWKNFKKADLLKHKEILKEVKMRMVNPDKPNSRNRQGDFLKLFKKSMTTITARLDKGQKDAPPFDMYRGYGSDFMPGENVAKFYGYRKDNWNWSAIQPAKIPNRKGMLTHPAWLIANAQNTETDPIHRGKWIREKLLAGSIPNMPITVDAVIPEDHTRTMRSRLAGKTEAKYCWKCHEAMNPLGYPLESYDDFGRFRTEESLEYPDNLIKKQPDKTPAGNHLIDLRDIYKTSPVDPTGYLKGTGDNSLDGEVKDTIDLTARLAKSRRVRQSIIRHAFRYFMGRNEYLSDSKTLIDAEQAYIKSEGSFDAVIVSLLTSDSFIYRKPIED